MLSLTHTKVRRLCGSRYTRQIGTIKPLQSLFCFFCCWFLGVAVVLIGGQFLLFALVLHLIVYRCPLCKRDVLRTLFLWNFTLVLFVIVFRLHKSFTSGFDT